MLHYCWAWPPTSWQFDGDLPMLIATLSAALGGDTMARWVGPLFVSGPAAGVINRSLVSSRTPFLRWRPMGMAGLKCVWSVHG